MGQLTYSGVENTSLAKANLDNFGRLEVSNDIALGEYTLDKGNLPLFFNQLNISGGTQNYSSTLNGQTLSVTASSGDAAIFQTKQWHPYFPGHPQQAEFTFIGFTPQTDVTKRVGYFSSSTVAPHTAELDGFYLESTASGVSFNIGKAGSVTSIDQTAWDDPLDGTGASKIAIDWDNFQVFLIDFLYLGGTTVNLYYIADGKRALVHTYKHSNNYATVIMETPSQPIRAEIRSSGGAGSFTFICAQVSTLGSTAAFSGTPFSVNTGNALIGASASGTQYVAFGVRKTVRSVELFPTDVSITSTAGATSAYLWKLQINPSLSGALTYAAVTNTYMDLGPGGGATVSADGHIVASGTGAGRSQILLENISKSLRIGETIAGVADQLVLSYTPLTTNHDFVATFTGVVI